MPTLKKSIKTLEDLVYISYTPERFYTVSALQLGIEALKLLRNYRKPTRVDLFALLPGETEGDKEE